MKRTQSLFDFASIYANRESISNEVLYKNFGVLNGIRDDELNKLEPIGKNGRMHSKEEEPSSSEH